MDQGTGTQVLADQPFGQGIKIVPIGKFHCSTQSIARNSLHQRAGKLVLVLNQKGFELSEIIVSLSSGQGSALLDLLHPLTHLGRVTPQAHRVKGLQAVSDRIDLGMAGGTLGLGLVEMVLYIPSGGVSIFHLPS